MITVERIGKRRSVYGKTQICGAKYAEWHKFRYARPAIAKSKKLTKINRVDVPGRIFR